MLKTVLWKNKVDSIGLCPIAISITGGGKRIYYNTGIKIPSKFWVNKKNGKEKEIDSKFKNADILNKTITKSIESADRWILNKELQNEKVTLEMVKKLLDPDRQEKISNGAFIGFYRDYLDLLDTKHTKGYLRHFEVEYRQLKKFAKGSLSFNEITAEWLESYEKDLKGMSTTKHTKMKRLKEVINRAIDRGLIEKKAIAGYKFPGYVQPERFYLTLDQTIKISKDIYSGKYDDDLTMKKIVCYFLIECYSALRFSDWKRFTIEKLINERNLKVRTQKTGAPVYLPLDTFKRLGTIVDYVLDNKIKFDLTEQATNRLLKVLGSSMKLSFPLTTHVGRHTFGTLLGEMGYSTAKIALLMGITEKTAKVYVTQTKQGLEYEFTTYGGL